MMEDMTTPSCCTSPPPGALTEPEASELARRLKALADPTRLRLLSIIAAHEGAEACVCDLTELSDVSQPTVSHHMSVLVDAGLVTREKRGKWAWYQVVPERLTALQAVLAPK